MKILFIITGLGIGGAEKVVIQLADEMNLLGHEIKIAYLTGEKKIVPTSPEIEIINLNLNNFKDFFSASLRYKNLIENFKPQIIHAHMFHANIFARINRIFIPTPKLICTAHSSYTGNLFRRLSYRLTNKFSDVLTNVSKEASYSFISGNICGSKDIITIYNGVDLNKFQCLELNKQAYIDEFSLSGNKKIILAVGRMHELKDYPNLLTAISHIAEYRKDFILLIAGDGELKPQIEDLIKNLEISEFVRLIGNRNDIPELMNISDIYVLSSKKEGLPTVLIEAMACENFIVATDCGGSKEILGDTGILVPPNNSLELANALCKALDLSPDIIKLNGIKSRKRAKQIFSVEKSVTKWLSLYTSI